MRKTLLPLALLTACLTATACSDSTGRRLRGIPTVSDMLADLARESVYLSGGTSGRLLSISSRTGLQEAEIDFPVPVGGLALDGCSNQLFVAVAGASRIDVVDLESFSVVESIRVKTDPRSLQWVDDDTLLVVSSNGLEQVTRGQRAVETLLPGVAADALHVLDRQRQSLYVAQRVGLDPEVFRYDLDSGLVVPSPDPALLGTPVGLHLSHDEDRLYVATDGPDGVYVLDPQTLARIDTIVLGAGLEAMAVNATSTRMYVAFQGDPTVTSLNLFDYGLGAQSLLATPVETRSLLVAANSQLLVAGLTDDSVDSLPLFEHELFGSTTAYVGEQVELAIHGDGSPDVLFFLIGSIEIGYLFLDPPSSPDPRFLDMDVAGLIPGILARNPPPSGEIEVSFRVPDEPLLEGLEMVLQSACSRELAGGGRSLECISNPLLIRVLPAECVPQAP